MRLVFTGIVTILLGPIVPFLSAGAPADSEYYRHTFYDNSSNTDAYYYSAGKAVLPSILKLQGGKLPVDPSDFFTPPNALRLTWQSLVGGAWEANIYVQDIRNREILFLGDTLSFWCYSPEGTPAAQLPRLRLLDTNKNFSKPLELAEFTGDLPAGKWIRIAIPVQKIQTDFLSPFDLHRAQSVIFEQGAADGAEHTLLLDEIRIDDTTSRDGNSAIPYNMLPAPQNVQARGYERHIDITWDPVKSNQLGRYVIYRTTDGKSFQPVGIQEPGITRYTDFLGKTDQTASYEVTASDRDYRESPFSSVVSASTRAYTDDELLTMPQEACFRFYWEGAHPDSGMIRESIPGDDRVVATGATGFGVMTLIVGVERGFVTRDQGIQRLTKMVDFLERAHRYHGAWSHFMDGRTRETLPVFGIYENGGDLVETAFLIQGLLAARQYFHGTSSKETSLYQRITQLWEAVEWDWYRKSPDSDPLYWYWSPEWTWYISHRLTGFNEVMIVYLLAIASPTHSVPADLYYTGWAGQSDAAVMYRRAWSGSNDGDHYLNGNTYFGINLDVGVGHGGPLFFTHYSYLGFDPHALTDRYTN